MTLVKTLCYTVMITWTACRLPYVVKNLTEEENMGIFRNHKRLNLSEQIARNEKELEMLESKPRLYEEDRNRIKDLAGLIARDKEKKEIIREKAIKKQKSSKGTTINSVSIGSSNIKKTGMVDSSVAIANRQESNKSQKTTKTKPKKKK